MEQKVTSSSLSASKTVVVKDLTDSHVGTAVLSIGHKNYGYNLLFRDFHLHNLLVDFQNSNPASLVLYRSSRGP